MKRPQNSIDKGPTHHQQRQALLASLRPAAADTVAALAKLKGRWPARTFIAELTKHDVALRNAAYNNFRDHARQLGMARVQAALWLARIDVPAGMNRQTNFDDDLEELLRIAATGGVLTEAVLCRTHSRLFGRGKKRAAVRLRAELNRPIKDSWKAVAYCLWKRDPSFDPARCFDHLTPGLYTDLPFLDGPQWYWDDQTPTLRRKHYVDLIGRMVIAGLHPSKLLPEPFRRLSDGANSLLRRIHNDSHRVEQQWNWGDIVAEATGTHYVADASGRSGGAHHLARGHARSLSPQLSGRTGAHKRLRSAEEATVDGVLALMLEPRRYERAHAHDVPLRALVPGHIGPESVDIVIVGPRGRAVVEVSNGRPDANYLSRLRGKKSALDSVGLPFVAVNAEKAGASYATELSSKLTTIVHAVGLDPVRDVRSALKALASAPSSKMAYPAHDEAARQVQKEGIETMAEYKLAYPRLHLPSNPGTYYRGDGWRSWSAFVGKERKPGRPSRGSP